MSLLLVAALATTLIRDYVPPDAVPADAVRKTVDLVFPPPRDLVFVVMNVRETATEIRIELAADVLFDFDSATLKPRATAPLEKAMAEMKSRMKSGAQVRIEGHTDGKGSATYNQGLSERRATAVADWMREHGARDAKITTKGLGATKPVAPNAKKDGSDDPEGRRKNRRVEIVIRK